MHCCRGVCPSLLVRVSAGLLAHSTDYGAEFLTEIDFGLDDVGSYWEQVIKINSWQQKRITRIIVEKLFGTLTNKKVAIFGFSFKANTNDTRESPAIQICKDLIEEGANLVIYDPKVNKEQIDYEFKSLNIINSKSSDYWELSNSVYEASQNTDAIVVMTEWDEFKHIDWSVISSNMRRPSWIFDTRNIIDKKLAISSGLNFWAVGG